LDYSCPSLPFERLPLMRDPFVPGNVKWREKKP